MYTVLIPVIMVAAVIWIAIEHPNFRKALWLTLAQSWVRLAEQVAYVENNPKRRKKGLRMKLIEFRGGASQPDEDQRHL